MVLASTCTIVINIERKIIHSALRVATHFKYFADLRRQAARNLQLNMDPVTFLIIKKFSMIGCRLILNKDITKVKQITISPLMQRLKAILLPAELGVFLDSPFFHKDAEEHNQGILYT